MKHRSTQLGVRKNPDSPRVHGLRLTVDSFSVQSQGAAENLAGTKLLRVLLLGLKSGAILH